jgi:hypothetical protein
MLEVASPVSMRRNREKPMGEIHQSCTPNGFKAQHCQPHQAGKFLQLDIGNELVTQSESATM